MESEREMLKEIAEKGKSGLTLRMPMGAAGKPYRHRARIVDCLVRDGLATWISRMTVRITTAGLYSLKE